MKKIIGIALIGLVLTACSAKLAEYLDQKYVAYCMNTVQEDSEAAHRQYLSTGRYPPPKYYTYNLVHPADMRRLVLCLGVIITILLLVPKLNLPKVYGYMIYSFIICFVFAVIFIVSNGQGEITTGSYNVNRLSFTKDPYIENSLYCGLAVSTLIFGIHLTTKTNK